MILRIILVLFLLICGVSTAESTGCGKDWFREDDSCYSKSSEQYTWIRAFFMCHHQDAYLISMNHAKEDRVINIFTMINSAEYFWTGASDLDQDGRWLWTEGGDELIPRFSEDEESYKYCLAMQKLFSESSPYFKLFPEDCNTKYDYLCEKSLSKAKAPVKHTCNGAQGWVELEDYCYFIVQTAYTWYQAYYVCTQFQAELFTGQTWKEDTIIGLREDVGYWIGVYKTDSNKWRWVDKPEFQDVNLYITQVEGKDCVSMTMSSSGEKEKSLESGDCETAKPFVCTKPIGRHTTKEPITTQAPTIIDQETESPTGIGTSAATLRQTEKAMVTTPAGQTTALKKKATPNIKIPSRKSEMTSIQGAVQTEEPTTSRSCTLRIRNLLVVFIVAFHVHWLFI